MNSYEYRDNLGNPRDYYDIVNDATKLCEEIEEKDKEIDRLNNIIDELKDDSRVLKEFSAWIVNRHEPDLFHKMEIVNKLSKLKEGK